MKRITLKRHIAWKLRRFCLSSWLKDVTASTRTEHAPSFLQDLHEQEDSDGLWTLFKEYLNIGGTIQEQRSSF